MSKKDFYFFFLDIFFCLWLFQPKFGNRKQYQKNGGEFPSLINIFIFAIYFKVYNDVRPYLFCKETVINTQLAGEKVDYGFESLS
jgi:hypothetical protein